MERISTIQTASVITQPTDATKHLTLVEKLDGYHQSLYERWYDNHKHPYDEGAMDAVEKAINIVKQHQAESDWVSVDEYRKIAKANDRVFVYDTFCEAVMPSLVRVIHGRAGFQLTNGLYAMHVSHVCSMTVPKPPSEVQND